MKPRIEENPGAYKEDNKVNAFVVKIENFIQMFWYDPETNEIGNPSVPIGDSEDYAYGNLTDRHIQFITMMMVPKDPNDMKLEVVKDYEKFHFYSVKKDRIELNEPVIDAMKRGNLEIIIKKVKEDLRIQ